MHSGRRPMQVNAESTNDGNPTRPTGWLGIENYKLVSFLNIVVLTFMRSHVINNPKL